MNHRIKLVFLVAGALLAGAVVGAIAIAWVFAPAYPSHWFALVPRPSSDTVVLRDNALDAEKGLPVSQRLSVVESDIGPLEVTALSGRARFLPHVSASDGQAAIGYVISVSAGRLDQSKLPEKYKRERTVEGTTGPLTLLPLDEATYEVYFTLSLLDRDGFTLLTTDSPKHTVRSGESSQVQAQTAPLVSRTIAAHTDKIAFRLVVNDCLSAGAE